MFYVVFRRPVPDHADKGFRQSPLHTGSQVSGCDRIFFRFRFRVPDRPQHPGAGAGKTDFCFMHGNRDFRDFRVMFR